MSVESIIKGRQAHINELLSQLLASAMPESRLQQAMRYSAIDGGKRMRAMMAFAAAEAVGGDFTDANTVAMAVELVHAYSLVHDDLPAMDDDELRRGKPSCHIAFDVATAILAGDALQALAFEILSKRTANNEPAVQLDMINILARASGTCGMVGGQSLDIHAAGGMLDETALSTMHKLKTGALIRASVLLGALSSGKCNDEQKARLGSFADCAGLAFQIRDDILDVEGDTRVLGKQQGKDQEANKPTYTSMLGVDGARNRLEDLYQQCMESISGFGEAAANLRTLARYIIDRIY